VGDLWSPVKLGVKNKKGKRMEDLENQKYNTKIKIIVAIFVTFTITFCGTILGYYKYLDKKGALIKSYESSKEISDKLNLVRTYIDYYYKGDIDEDNLSEGAIKGYVEGLGDEYTEFLTKKEFDNLNAMLSQTVGIGAYLAELKNSSDVVIIGLVEDAPAEKSGLKAGDVIKEVNLENVSGKGSEYVASKLKNGPAGSTVKVKILRDNEELEYDIIREEIKYYKIKHEMKEKNIGYIDFDSFTETSYDEFKEAYEELKANGAKSLIIDLRDNTGGQVDQVLKIADLFIESGKPILITEDKNGNRITNSSRTDKIIDMPTVVLVNDYTASASEILTGFLKDYKLATIVGIKTYGKGVIQNVYTNVFGENSGVGLKITVAEYYTPNGNRVHHEGIEPDEVVETKKNIENEEKKDIQLEKAIEILKNR